MKIKVVILNWNGRKHLEQFLGSVVRNTPEADIVVADNGSTDDSLDFLRANFPTVELILLESNYGYAEGYNRALEHIEAEYCVLLNSDIEVAAGWLKPLVKRMNSDKKIFAVAPKIRQYANSERFEYAGAAGGFIDFWGYPFCRGRILDEIEIDNGQYDDAREVFWASGACMVVRTDVFKALGGFDSTFFAHMEEIDLCWRAQLAGYKIEVEPASMVLHLGGGTLPNNSPHKLYLNYRNNLSMLYKNLSPGKLLFVMTGRMILDGLSALVFLLQRRPDLFRVVFDSHIDFYKRLPHLNNERKRIMSMKIASVKNIYNGGIILRYALGRRKFDHMM